MNLAARGARQLTPQIEKIEDAQELAQVRRQSRRVWLQSLGTATALTLLTLAI